MKNIELMLSHLFRMNADVPNELISEMQKRIKAEQVSWRRRNIAQERLGYSVQEAERAKKYYRAKKPKWMRRKLSDDDRAILASTWR